MTKGLRFLFILALMVTGVHTAGATEPERTYGTMKFQGETREYYVYVPENLIPEKPLVFMTHGHGGNAKTYYADFINEAKEYGFAVCWPQGLNEPGGRQATSWNVGYPMQEGWEVDDCAFILALAKKLQKEYGLNPKNVFFSGLSNGGEFCYYLAHRYPGKFAAIASLAGLNMEWIYKKYQNPAPVPFMEIHGTADMTSKWVGDPENKDGWGSYISVPAAVGRRISINNCTHEICDTLDRYTPKSNMVIRHHYVGGTDVKDVILYEIIDGGHSTGSQDMDVSRTMLDFFSRYLTK